MITINRIDGYNAIISGDKTILDKIKEYLTITYMGTVYDWRSKRRVPEKCISGYYEEKDNCLVVKLGFAIAILTKFSKYVSSANFNNDGKIEIIPKWVEIFRNHPDADKGKDQEEFTKVITKSKIGIASIQVGGGKTEMILSIAESFLNQFDGNIAIMTFSSKVLNEIEIRADKYSIKDSRIRYFCPTGYLRRHESKEPEAIEWLSNVSLILVDEAHHFTSLSGLWADFVSICNPEYLYAFTGSADSEDGGTITFDSPDTTETPQVMSMIAFCGEMLVHRELTANIHLIRVNVEVTKRNEYNNYLKDNTNSQFKVINQFIRTPQCIKVIQNIIERAFPKDAMCFIPELTSIDNGVYLAKELNALGIPTVFFSASTVETPKGELNNITLEDLKDLAKCRAFKVLISNVVGTEGLDISGLNSVIALTGRSFKDTIQPLGRSARSNEVWYALIWDKYNHVLNRHTQRKFEFVTNRMNVVSNRELKVDV